MSTSSQSPLKYAGFISYSRKDAGWAKKIQRALERYRLPIRLDEAGRPKKTLGKFFRDEDELAGAPSLGASLRGALEDSRSLIVVCSPNAAGSDWVDQEIRHFKAKRPDGAVFGVIVAGKPDAQDPALRCFPPALLHKVDDDGRLTDEGDEPLAPDATAEPFARVKTRLAAGLVGVGFDELWKREQRRQRTRRLMALGGLVAIGVGGYVALDEYVARAREAAFAGIIQDADLQTERALKAFRQGDRKSAVVLAASAIPRNVPEDVRDRFADNLAALDEIHNTRIVDLPTREAVSGTFSRDGRFVATSPVALIQGNVDGNPLLIDLSKIDLSTKEGVSVWDATTGELIRELLPPEEVISPFGTIPVTFSPDGRYLAAGGARKWVSPRQVGSVYVWDTETWDLVFREEVSTVYLDFSGDAEILRSGSDEQDWFWDFRTGALLATLPPDDCASREMLTSSGQKNFFIARNVVYRRSSCTGMEAPGLYEFDPGTGTSRKIVELDLEVQMWRAMVASRYVPLRTRDRGIVVVDHESGEIAYQLDAAFSQFGSLAVILSDGKPVLVTVALDGGISFFDLDTGQETGSPFGYALDLRADSTKSKGDVIPTMMDTQPAQIFWDRARVATWDDLAAIIAAQPEDWQQEIRDGRADLLNISKWDMLFR